MLEESGLLYLSTIEGNYEDSNYEHSSDGLHKIFVYYYSEDFISCTLNEKQFTLFKTIKITYKKGKVPSYIGSKALHR